MNHASLAVTAAVLAILAGGEAPAHAAPSVNSASFRDSCTDAGNSPELCTIDVSNDDSGKIKFVLGLPNQGDFGLIPNAHVTVALDTDGNPKTGCGATGAEIALTAQGRLTSVAFLFGVCENGDLNYSSLGGAFLTGCVKCPSEAFMRGSAPC